MNFFMVGKEMNCRQSVFLAMGRRVELRQGKGWAAYRAFFSVWGVARKGWAADRAFLGKIN